MGYHFKDAKILIEALTHPSYAYESLIPNAPDFNRLEFLGDGVIGMIVAENLYRERPNADEGDLTRQRSLIVSREALAKRAVTLGVGAYVFVGKGEEKTGGRTNMTNLSAVIEALIGAVYIDGGLEAARAFIARACV